jgi:hypothetical protein
MSEKSLDAEKLPPRFARALKNAKELLAKWFSAGVDLFIELIRIEESEDWQGPTVETFEDFLNLAFPAGSPIDMYVYGHVKAALEAYGDDLIRKVGPQGCHALIQREIIESESKKALVVASIAQHYKSNGVPVSSGEVRRIVRGIAKSEHKLANTTLKALRTDREKEENGLLRKENAQLKKENAQLRKENARLSKEVESLKSRQRRKAA